MMSNKIIYHMDEECCWNLEMEKLNCFYIFASSKHLTNLLYTPASNSTYVKKVLATHATSELTGF